MVYRTINQIYICSWLIDFLADFLNKKKYIVEVGNYVSITNIIPVRIHGELVVPEGAGMT